jgi:biopolymer transport protein ExbD
MIEIKTGRPRDTSINLTPLVDVVFLLLIFFLLTAFFIQPEGVGVRLPEADGTPDDAKAEVVVVVEASGRVLVSDVEVSLDELEDQVRAALARDPSRPVVIRADRRLVLQKAVSVMERCKRAGASRLIIATESPPPEK